MIFIICIYKVSKVITLTVQYKTWLKWLCPLDASCRSAARKHFHFSIISFNVFLLFLCHLLRFPFLILWSSWRHVWHCLLVQGAQECFYKIFFNNFSHSAVEYINIIFARPMAEVHLCKSLYQYEVKLGVKEMEVYGTVSIAVRIRVKEKYCQSFQLQWRLMFLWILQVVWLPEQLEHLC